MSSSEEVSQSVSSSASQAGSQTGSQAGPATMSGKRVLLMIFLVLCLVPPGVWVTLRWVESRKPEMKPLVWAERATWRGMPLRKTSLSATGFLTPPKNAGYRNTDLVVSAEEQALIERAAGVVESADDFASAETGEALLGIVENEPPHFYTLSLMALWYELQGQMKEAEQTNLAEQTWAAAAGYSPAMLRLPVHDEAGQPLAGVVLEKVVVRVPQVVEKEMQEPIRLVYPRVTSDGAGHVYLPSFLPPVDFEAVEIKSGDGVGYKLPLDDWHVFPGRIGQVEPVVVLEGE